jgi:hypothetical protein
LALVASAITSALDNPALTGPRSFTQEMTVLLSFIVGGLDLISVFLSLREGHLLESVKMKPLYGQCEGRRGWPCLLLFPAFKTEHTV